MTERLVHFSAEPITALHTNFREPGWAKPRGFWVSVEGIGDGWSDWCGGEGFAPDSFIYEYDVTLSPDAQILWIRSAEELDAFTARWRRPNPDGYRGMDTIHWAGVAETHQGIIIAPYLWSRRLDFDSFWYYGWDCASGCIWDVSVISLGPAREVSLNADAEDDAAGEGGTAA